MLSIYKLPNQIPGEKVLKVVRRDLFILFKTVVMFIFLCVLPLAVGVAVLYGKVELLDNEIFKSLLILGVSAYYLFIWLFLFFGFIDYFLDVWIITSERIINIEQDGFFARTISEQKLTHIEDVTSETKGIMSTFLKFGYLYVQTAAEKERFIFKDVPDPDGLRDMIMKLTEGNKRYTKEPESNVLK